MKLWRLWHRIIGFLKMFVWFLSNLQGLKRKISFSRRKYVKKNKETYEAAQVEKVKRLKSFVSQFILVI